MQVLPGNEHKLKMMKRVATSLLVVAAALLALAKFHHDAGPWAWLSAFAEASMVGALADWFAVVALFRRPMGLPIPHTAILPSNKARVADALAVFVRDKFLGTDALLAKIPALDPAAALANWLREPKQARLAADKLADGIAVFVRAFDDTPLKDALAGLVRERARDVDVSGAVGQMLDLFTENRRHQSLLDEGIKRAALWLDDPAVQQYFANRIVAVAGEEYPTLISALGLFGVKTEEVGVKLAGALVRGFHVYLHEISENPEHERRQAFDAAVQGFIDKLKIDEAFLSRIDEAKLALLRSPALSTHIDRIWESAREHLLLGLATSGSSLRVGLTDALATFGDTLLSSRAWCDALNAQCATFVAAIAPAVRETVSAHIAQTVREWDDAVLVQEVERSVGSDLQFIRINGTIVGGLAGLTIHAVTTILA
ncbi:hypothetical protein WM40_20285 [Robbsia andropogonis]|uniref:DUF445 domain-containing protein n=2 Tax=Robbsia andropogonis TaxID=28092 RepID=A0A0F5JVN2_9BURK|nr:hypothetical protein WM40_20285 [Robbsia andropogonis]